MFVAWRVLGREPRREDWLHANRVMIAGMRAARIRPWIRRIVAWALSTPLSRRRYKGAGPGSRFADVDALAPRTEGPRRGEAP